ncbi:MAG: YihY/virulence factor BrkB family protein [Alkalispirochaeta sp.]
MIARLRARTKRIIRRYISINGPLLAKGLSFSVLFATVPLLFLLSVAGSIALTPEVQQLLQDQFFGVLPNSAQASINTSMSRLADSPGSLSILSLGVFLWSVHQLFFDVHRVVRAGFGMAVSPGTGRARAIALSGLFLLLIYATALLNLTARVMTPYLPVSGLMLQVIALSSSTVILTVVLWSLIRLGSGVQVRVRETIIPALMGAIVWQGASWLAGLAVLSAGRRLIVYGVLASAVLFLMLMRVYAEILIYTSLWIRELHGHPVGAEE